jgi:hypothetical protein
MLGRPPGERRIATGQKLQMSEISARQAEGTALLLQGDHRTAEKLSAAFGAYRVTPDQKNQNFSGLELRRRSAFGIHGMMLAVAEISSIQLLGVWFAL